MRCGLPRATRAHHLSPAFRARATLLGLNLQRRVAGRQPGR
jgi:hypothetical protein